MPYQINEKCIICNYCVPVCPVNAIYIGEDIFEINEKRCIECKGFYDEPQCDVVCPVNAIYKKENNYVTNSSNNRNKKQ